MSCNYADGLSNYDNKGILGIPEKFDIDVDVDEKCERLVDWLLNASHVVVHTGAGISTTAGIPDFRGPKGVWTLEEKGEKPVINISFEEAIPTKTHMALCALVEHGYVHYIVSQNIDGLHLKSGLARKYIAELHGNMFVEQCNKCRRQFVRTTTAAPTVGQKPCGGTCRAAEIGDGTMRACRSGVLLDNVLDWEHDLPERDLDMAQMHSTIADLNITLGTTLQIIPSGNLPLKNLRHKGKLVICNLQPTKHDKKAQLVISTYVDDVLTKVCKRLGIEIPDYSPQKDPTKSQNVSEWTLHAKEVMLLEKQYNEKQKKATEARKLAKDKTGTFLIKKIKTPKAEIELKPNKKRKIKEDDTID